MPCKPGPSVGGATQEDVDACYKELKSCFEKLLTKYGQPAAVSALEAFRHDTYMERHGFRRAPKTGKAKAPRLQ